MAAASCGGSVVPGCWVEPPALRRNVRHYEEIATAHSGLHAVLERNLNYGAKSGAPLFRMSDAATGALYRCLSASIRRLCEDLQAGASAYGYLDPARTCKPVTALSREHLASRGPWTLGLQRSVSQDRASAGCSDSSSSTSLPKESATLPPTAASWRFSATAKAGACAAGVASVAAGGAAIFFRGGKVAQLVIAVPVTATLAMAACWFVAWGLLEFTVRRSAKKLPHLLANLRLQHKLAREAVRWIQELEVTVKAFSNCPIETPQTSVGCAGAVPNCAGTPCQRDTPLGEEPQEAPSLRDPPCAGVRDCSGRLGGVHADHFQQQRTAARAGGQPASRLRLRLCQVLEWQEHVFCSVYDDVTRPAAHSRLACQSFNVPETRGHGFVSRRHWSSRGMAVSSDDRFDGDLQNLKDLAARCWSVHSRLCAGLQIALRHLLFSLEVKLLRGQEAAGHRIGFDAKRGPVSFAAETGKLVPRSSRTLRGTLVALQQQSSASTACKPLAEEIAAAGMPRRVASAGVQKFKPGGTLFLATPASSSISDRRAQLPNLTPSPFEKDFAGGERQNCLIWIVSQAASVVGLRGLGLLTSAAEALALSWWLVHQLNRLARAISTAAEVAAEATQTLRAALEEDWVSCPVSLPEPRWTRGAAEGQSAVDALPLVPCAPFPPPVAFHPFNIRHGALAPAQRTALASMSRHVAAALAVLRLPTACCCDGSKWPHEGAHGLREIGTWCYRSVCALCARWAGSARTPEHKRVTEMAEEGRNTGDDVLRAAVQLTLQHLRAAVEEGEKLQRSLRSTGQATKTIAVSPSEAPTGGTELATAKAAVKTSGGVETADETEQLPVAKPPRRLEVYTAVGSDSSSNRDRYQEEAALLAAFAEEDHVVRERSQITLRELEIKLKEQERELQNIPRVLKELSSPAPEAARDSACGTSDAEGTLCLVVAADGAALQCEEVSSLRQLAAGSPSKGDEGNKTQEVSALASNMKGERDAEGIEAKRAVVFCLQQEASLTQERTDNTAGFPETERSSEWLDTEDSAFRLRWQQHRDDPAACESQTSETASHLSLMSQLQGVLAEQRKNLGEKRELPRSAAAPSAAAQAEDIATTFGDNVDDDEEWDSCDLVEGPDSGAEVPVWVAAPLDPGDNQLNVTNMQQDDTAALPAHGSSEIQRGKACHRLPQ